MIDITDEELDSLVKCASFGLPITVVQDMYARADQDAEHNADWGPSPDQIIKAMELYKKHKKYHLNDMLKVALPELLSEIGIKV